MRGLGNPEKRADILNYLKSKNYSIYFLQETHFTDNETKFIRAQWGYECYFSNFSSQTKGVAILFNNNFEFKVHNIITEEEYPGVQLILDVTIEDKRMLLVNVYGPNRNDANVYMSLIANILEPIDEHPAIIAGDFNLVLNPDMDSYNYKHVNNPDNRDQMLDILIDYNLVDVWRDLNLEEKQYTWRRKKKKKQTKGSP